MIVVERQLFDGFETAERQQCLGEIAHWSFYVRRLLFLVLSRRRARDDSRLHSRLRLFQHRRHELLVKRGIDEPMSLRAHRRRLGASAAARPHLASIASFALVHALVQVHAVLRSQGDVHARLHRFHDVSTQFFARHLSHLRLGVIITVAIFRLSRLVQRRPAALIDDELAVKFFRFLFPPLSRPRDAPPRRHRGVTTTDVELRFHMVWTLERDS